MSERRPLIPIASALADLRKFPADVQDIMGQALLDAQYGDTHPDAKPLRGFGGTAVMEIVDDFDGDTYRAVYTVRLASGVYLLHAFPDLQIEVKKFDPELFVRCRQCRPDGSGM